MTSKLSRADRRRRERQRQQIRNIIIISGLALIVAGFFLWTSNRPVDDLVIPPARTFPVPVDGLTIGSPDAPVLVEAFEDFQCPSCLRFTEDFEPLMMQNYVNTGIARFTFRFFPFIGPESLSASSAALCASDQGRFWEFHDTLFANQLGENIGAFSDRRLSAMAGQLGLDLNSWEACFNDGGYEAAVTADLSEGRARGVTGTPTIFVNGTALNSFDYQTISFAIEQAAAGQ